MAVPDTVLKPVEMRTSRRRLSSGAGLADHARGLSPPLPSSKPASGVPAPAAHELRRERLLEALHRHRARPLILLVAAAGFGKSTLAATYARDSGAAVAWLSLEAADRDSRRFFGRLAEALEAGFDEPGSVAELRKG